MAHASILAILMLLSVTFLQCLLHHLAPWLDEIICPTCR